MMSDNTLWYQKSVEHFVLFERYICSKYLICAKLWRNTGNIQVYDKILFLIFSAYTEKMVKLLCFFLFATLLQIKMSKFHVQNP